MRIVNRGVVGFAVVVLIASSCAYCAGWVTGHGRFEKIAGKPAMGYKELYEWDLYLSPSDNSWVGPSRRLGAPPGEPARGDGYYRIDNVPAGIYSIYVTQPDFFASPKLVPNVEVVNGQGTTVNVELDVDYSTYYFPGTWSEWQWDWYQTFKATGTSVRGIQWIMAGTGGSQARVAILESNGMPDVRTWPEVGAKTKNGLGSNSDQWVRWFSGEIPLVPEQIYAVYIHIDGGFAVYKRDRDGDSYAYGRAYHGHSTDPMPYDLNITVFVDKNGQMATHTMDASKDWELHGDLAAQRWGQSFVATGGGLAAVDVFITSGNDTDDMDITWKIMAMGGRISQIGPTKTTKRAYFTPHNHLMGVSYNAGEVPLTPGQTYVIELTDTEDFTPYMHTNPRNEYEDGQAFRNGTATEYDLAMTIMQHKAELPTQFITHFYVVRKVRLARTLFEYECRVILENTSSYNIRNVLLEMTEAPENMNIIQPTVIFGRVEIGPGESAISTGTCTFQVDRADLINPAEILWEFEYVVDSDGHTMSRTLSTPLAPTFAVSEAEFTGDHSINFADLTRLSVNWLWSGGDGEIQEDVVQDGRVNFIDFAGFAQEWHEK
ncbi:MAG: carboxypeptidase regulatory-like domain-containing protein [Sedimentisphaerales bacterium]|nr:carboxypeptidase regulatory-like domain-containing protein [Sedimentisphaerales bacterium]